MISPFGVDHGDPFSKRSPDPKRQDKVFGSGAKTGAIVGGVAAAAISRNKANALGGKIGAKMVRRGRWSAGRTTQMKNPKLKEIRTEYARKLIGAGKEVGRNNDTREIAGRAAVGAAAGTIAGGTVYGRKRLTPVDRSK